VRAADTLASKVHLVSGTIFGLCVVFLTASSFKPIRGTIASPLVRATGALLGGVALAIMTGKEVLDRERDADWQLTRLKTQQNWADALSLCRYWNALYSGLDCDKRVFPYLQQLKSAVGNIPTALLEKGRRLYLFDYKGETLPEAQQLFSQLTTRNYVTLAEAKLHIPKENQPQFQGEAKSQMVQCLPLLRNQGFFDTTYPSFKKYDALIIYDQPEFRSELQLYITVLWKRGVRFDRMYVTTTVKDLPRYTHPTNFNMEAKPLKKKKLKDHTCLVVTGAPFVPNIDMKLRAKKPQLKFETVGPSAPQVTFDRYAKEIWDYVKNCSLPKAK